MIFFVPALLWDLLVLNQCKTTSAYGEPRSLKFIHSNSFLGGATCFQVQVVYYGPYIFIW